MSDATLPTVQEEQRIREIVEYQCKALVEDGYDFEPLVQALAGHLKQYGEQIHNELTDNENKVWLYREDYEKRLIQERIDEVSGIPLQHGRHTTIRYVGEGKVQSIKDRYAELTALKATTNQLPNDVKEEG